MGHTEILQKYKEMGLETEEGSVEPNFVYPPHHHGTTHLYITAGSVTLKRDRDNGFITYTQGSEFVVDDGEYHEGQAGKDGYSFIAGWNEQEYQKYPEDQWY